MQASSVTIYTPANASLCITCIASCHRYCLCIDIHGVYTIPCLLWMCFFKRDLLNVVTLPSSLPGIWEYVIVSYISLGIKCVCACAYAHVRTCVCVGAELSNIKTIRWGYFADGSLVVWMYTEYSTKEIEYCGHYVRALLPNVSTTY